MDILNNIPDDFEDLEKYAPALSKISKNNCFIVPDSYFTELPEVIRMNAITMQFSKQNPFSVPDNYFNELSLNINALTATPVLSENKFEIPENYFEELPKEIETGIITSSFPKGNAFEVPAGYFNQLPTAINSKITSKPKDTKVLRLDWFSKAQLLAVAASVVIVCTIGFNYLHKSSNAVYDNKVSSINNPIEKTWEERIENLDESTLEEALSEEEESNTLEQSTTQLASNDYIVNYLVDNNIDISTLTNELKDSE